MIHCIIRSKSIVLHAIIQLEFATHPFRLETNFRLVLFLHQFGVLLTQLLGGTVTIPCLLLLRGLGIEQTHYMGLEVSRLIQSVGIQMNHLCPFTYSLSAPRHFLVNKTEMNGIIKDDIYRQYIQVTWENLTGVFSLNNLFAVGQFQSAKSSHYDLIFDKWHMEETKRIRKSRSPKVNFVCYCTI